MTILHSTTLATALALGTISFAQAAPKAASPASQARALLEDVNDLSRSMTMAADQLAADAKRAGVQDVELARLDQIKDDINRIGKDLRALDGEQGELVEWERNAIQSITPLMVDAAQTAEQAFKTYDPNRNHLWATPFSEESAEIYKDAREVNGIVGSYLSLANLDARQQHLEEIIGGSH